MKKMNHVRSADVYFYERQRIRQLWYWFLFIGVDVIFVMGVIQQIVFKKPFGNNPVSDAWLIILMIGWTLFTVLFLSASLQTFINKEGVFIKFSPFQFRYKFYDWNNIQTLCFRKYSPEREFGGWGIRVKLWDRSSKVYSVSGNIGLELIIKNGKKVMIGTTQPDSLKTILEKLEKMEQMKNGKEREND